MLTLLLDTSTERGIVAISDDDKIVVSKELEVGLSNSQSLWIELEGLLSEGRVGIADIKCVAAGIGPGSYTGIRVAVIVAKSFSFAQGIPLVGVPTLQMFVPERDGPYAVVIDAKVGGFYLLQGDKRGDQITFKGDSLLVPKEEILEVLQGIETIVTPNPAPIQRRLPPDFRMNWETRAPDAEQMARVALKMRLDGQYSVDQRLDILYLRKTQAEIEKELGQ